MSRIVRLGVNIDHVATIRNARGGFHPDPVDAAIIAQNAGADGITVHLREDRRHIRDEDLVRLKEKITLPINLEMAATKEMLKIALRVKPNAVCIVPEKRREVTTEGGLDVISNREILTSMIREIKSNNIRVSLFIDASEYQVEASKSVDADIIEIHTGAFCKKYDTEDEFCYNKELEQIKKIALLSEKLELECHAGHGLNYNTARIVSNIAQISELNIGHFIIGESVFFGLEHVIKKMKQSIISNMNF